MSHAGQVCIASFSVRAKSRLLPVLIKWVIHSSAVPVLDGSQDLHDGQDADAPVVGGVLSDSSVDEVRLEGPADPASGVSRIEL